ncbi:MAG: DUF29 domain-containing protein [Aquificaceae bacterium]
MTEVENKSMEKLKELYERDFTLWAEINCKLLKEKKYEQADWENILEELQDMARRYLDSATSYLTIILEHLYKLEHFKKLEDAGSGWVDSILNARERIERLLRKHPSLKQKLPAELQDAWEDAILELRAWLRKNRIDPDTWHLPEKSPYTYEEAMTRDVVKEFKNL